MRLITLQFTGLRFTGLRLRRAAACAVASAVSLLSVPICWAGETNLAGSFPLLAKSSLIGYALVFLGVLLGLLAVLIPSMRKSLRRKDG